MQKQTLLDQLQVQYIDHIAVTTYDMEATVKNYLCIPGARLLKGPCINAEQKVDYCFVQIGDTTFEILTPQQNSDSPITTHLNSGGGPYHVCYAVINIDTSLDILKMQGAKILVSPVPDVAFDGRRVMFAYTPELGVFELVETLPAKFDSSQIPQQTAAESARIDNTTTISGNIPDAIKAVFSLIFPNLTDKDIEELSMENNPLWDSLRHLRLIMELENILKKSIPSSDIYDLTNFRAILDYIEKSNG
ncbi:MAG: VOC family protein [Gammaproteobacteria bacterium]|nr:VOC family protein [Gammaproteobacteria bacterium]